MGRNAGRSILLEDMLDRPRREGVPLLARKERAFGSVTDESAYLVKRLFIDENNANFAAFPLYPDGMLGKINVLNVHVRELGYPHPSGINRPHNETITGIFNLFQKMDHLVVLEVHELLILDAGTLDTREGIG